MVRAPPGLSEGAPSETMAADCQAVALTAPGRAVGTQDRFGLLRGACCDRISDGLADNARRLIETHILRKSRTSIPSGSRRAGTLESTVVIGTPKSLPP